MAAPRSLVNVGRVVDPLEGLQRGFTQAGDLYNRYLDREREKEQAAESKRRWEAQFGIQQAQEQRAADKYSRDVARQEALKGTAASYRPDIAAPAYSLAANRGILESTNQKVVDEYNKRLQDRGLGKGTPMSEVFSREEMSDINKLYQEAPAWQEQETGRLTKELLARGLGPKEAATSAAALTSGLPSLSAAQEQESGRAKYLQEREDKETKRMLDIWKASSKDGRRSSKDKKSLAEVGGTEYVDPKKYDAWFFQSGSKEAQEAVKNTVDMFTNPDSALYRKVEPDVLDKALKASLLETREDGVFNEDEWNTTLDKYIRLGEAESSNRAAGRGSLTKEQVRSMMPRQVTPENVRSQAWEDWIARRDELLGRQPTTRSTRTTDTTTEDTSPTGSETANPPVQRQRPDIPTPELSRAEQPLVDLESEFNAQRPRPELGLLGKDVNEVASQYYRAGAGPARESIINFYNNYMTPTGRGILDIVTPEFKMPYSRTLLTPEQLEQIRRNSQNSQ